jgi:hypothetical protein
VQSQDQFDVIRGLEVLAKLCSQAINPNDVVDYQNEYILSTSQVVCSREDGVASYKIVTVEPETNDPIGMDVDVSHRW